jgi:stage II sporulation protein R
VGSERLEVGDRESGEYMRGRVLKVVTVAGVVMAVSLASAVLALGVTTEKRKTVQNTKDAVYYQEKLIRFHVIANSNSKNDQELKLKVRDAVVKEMSQVFEKVKNIDEAKMIAENNLELIKVIAQNEIKAQGEDYPVRVMLGKYPFPVRKYGNLVLPAGEYQAVRVIIGEGTGANWWCVLFPPLCFVDIATASTPRETVSIAEAVYEESENQVTERVEIKFKILEILGWD